MIQDLYDNAPCGYHSLDPDGTFVRINNTELNWVGYTREEVVGRMKFSDILTADGLANFRERFSDFKERGWVRILSTTWCARTKAVKESEGRLRYLASRLLTAQEAVRKHIACELHDDLGQSLTALKLQMRALQQGLPAAMSEAKDDSEAMLDYINEIVAKVRSIPYNLRPPVLDLGLTTALNSLREFLIDQNMEVSMDLCSMDGLLSSEKQIVIYRVFQEPLTNIVEHAQATRIVITARQEDGLLAFQIDDNGQGFDLEEVHGRGTHDQRLGLTTIDERVHLLGGSLKISSAKGKGTSLYFTIPISPLYKTTVE